MSNDTIIVYGTTWCPDCHRARRVLDEQEVPYRWIDVEARPEEESAMLSVNGDLWKVPTIVFPDGSVLVEPSNRELASHLRSLAA